MDRYFIVILYFRGMDNCIAVALDDSRTSKPDLPRCKRKPEYKTVNAFARFEIR
jgi:hypothetical protein